MFACLADPTRRDILTQLGAGPATVSALAAPTGTSLTNVRKHVQALEDAGLVVTEKVGRSRQCRLTRAPLDEAMAWLECHRRTRTRRRRVAVVPLANPGSTAASDGCP
ncbi:metalloregulator ArsR/SmtB family transcription factor [Micromonospora sediminicola]|uniref:ArsR/SmtB family transcription factor n=1 Tax=Micromonospora sediminicola TaxID=946078 RepID=UPI0033C67FF6